MKCPRCKFETPVGAKFCNECGQKLEISCSECSRINPPGSKFCIECGHQLTQLPATQPMDLSFDQKIEKIQKYLPKGLTEKILAQRDRIEGERKQVTVMFCDMEGFTPLVEELGSEEAYSIMDEVYEILIHKVHDYEGTVNEMTGDGIMALFGAPIALEDASQRAIRSAIAIHREMAKFSATIQQEKETKISLRMRVGIHTGTVIVGTLGNNLRVEFKAVGDTVNLASRMEKLAEPGTIYVSEDTFKLTGGFFRFEALGEKEIKGKTETVKIYRVIAPSTSRTRFDVSADRGLTPFIGRRRELELLLDSFERVKAGRGQAVSLVAEAGLGKSRLLYEFRKEVSSEDVLFLEGRCLSYSRGVAFYSIIDILKANFDIRQSDRESEIKEKIKKGINIVKADVDSTLPYLLELFSVKESGIDKFALSPGGKKDQIIEAVKRITLKGSEIRPLILSYEDLHWIDKSSEDLLKHILKSIPGARILMIFTYRPEFVHTWGSKSYHSQLTLNRLSNRESLAMITNRLGTEEIDGHLEEMMLEKTEGIPFFIEEFIKSLKDLNIIEAKNGKYYLVKDIQEVSLPSTIQDVIMARVDSLPEGAKELLQTGSVVEREFSYKLIKRVTSLSQEELLSYLSVLKDAELLYERGIYPESTYIFKHALTREVVYDSILTKRKKKLHKEIGNAIEDLYKNDLIEHYEVLAEHFITSEDHERGAEYSRLAAKKAVKTASFIDAFAYSEKRIFCLEKLPVTANAQKKIIDARTTLGLYFSQLGQLAEAKKAVDPIINIALQSGYQKRLSQIHTIIGFYNCFIEENLPKALHHLEEALRISEKLNHVMSLFFATYWLSIALWHNCEFEKAINYIKKALEINVAANSLWGVVAMKSELSRFYNWQGRVDMGYQISQEALRIAEESGDIYSKAWAYSYHGRSCLFIGLFEEARDCLLKGADFSEKIDFLKVSEETHRDLGFVYSEMGKFQKSKEHYSKSISFGEIAGTGSSEIKFCKTAIASAKVMNNERDIDLELLYGHAAENKSKHYEGWLLRNIGEILLNFYGQHLDDVENWIEKAKDADKRNGMMWHLGRDYALFAELFKRRGDQPKAKKILAKAINIFKECGADGWVEKYEKDLAEL
jgi:predicted ATPase/class 3 adenylate cyclase